MGLAFDTAVEMIGDATEWVLGKQIASGVRMILPGLPPEPVFFDLSINKSDAMRPGIFQKFRFFSRMTRYVMDDALWRDLDNFFTSGELFASRLITGPAGAGKSRTGLTICEVLKSGRVALLKDGVFHKEDVSPVSGENHSAWKTGFVNLAATPISTWEVWRPRQHTLLVIDDLAKAFGYRLVEKSDDSPSLLGCHDVARIMKVLARRAEYNDFGPFRVRILLLERDRSNAQSADWYREIDNASPASLVRPVRLNGVAPEGLKRIAHDVEADILRRTGELAGSIPDNFAEKLRTLDSERRPLIAMLLAEHCATGGQGVVTLEQLLDGVIRKEARLCLAPVDHEITVASIEALALSTVTAGRDGDVQLEFKDHGLLDTNYGYAYGDVANRFHFYPLGPELLGEYFVLGALGKANVVGDDLTISGVSLNELFHEAWSYYPAETADFFMRAAEDCLFDPKWVETLFIAEEVDDTTPTIKLWYMRAAAGIMEAFRKKDIKLAVRVYHRMKVLSKGGLFRRERARAVVSLIRVYCEAGLLDQASSAFMSLRALGGTGDLRQRRAEAAATLVEGLCKGGEIVRARVLFEGELSFGDNKEILPSRARALVALISAYGRSGQVGDSIELFEQLDGCGDSDIVRNRRAQARLNLIVLNARSGRIKEAFSLFHDMKSLGQSEEVQDSRVKAFKFLDFFVGGKSGKKAANAETVAA